MSYVILDVDYEYGYQPGTVVVTPTIDNVVYMELNDNDMVRTLLVRGGDVLLECYVDQVEGEGRFFCYESAQYPVGWIEKIPEDRYWVDPQLLMDGQRLDMMGYDRIELSREERQALLDRLTFAHLPYEEDEGD